MAVEYMNDSYNRCIAELRTRYRGRAVSSSVKDEAAVNDDKSALTESYILFDSRSKIADTYRSGEYNGSKYMTSEDFVRYFRSRRAFYMPSAQKAQEAKAEEAEKEQEAPEEKATADAQLDTALQGINVIVEAYPELKSDATYVALMDELEGSENRIAVARKDYNGAVKKYNTKMILRQGQNYT